MAESADSDGVELSLGLSLNGRFGVNPKSPNNNNNLMRSSSSVSNFLETPQNAPLARTCSLPVEAEEETRKRREIQMLRRMEAKRKRSEKQRREIKRGEKLGGNAASNKVGFLGHGFGFKFGFDLKPGVRRNGLVGVSNGNGDSNAILPPPLSQQGSSASSSGTSESESQTPPPPPTAQGVNKSTEAKSPQCVQSFGDPNEQRPVLWPRDPKRLRKTTSENMTMVNTHLNPSRSTSATSNVITNVLADMPCVSTKEEGPNGKRVEGFLYRYRKEEEVRIVCVCHGSFLTPAEFIKHAGGGDVEHPLRHIVVKPSPF